MFRLGRTGSIPLVNGRFEAWDYGPVNPELYQRLKIYDAASVRNIFRVIYQQEN